eukprot:CAMPEP_0194211092 /NCGR_PEP_ID=MMETSP0156-20130528/9347_1 /TAXON_ID=33649 /ORGANISM="Thalassionema nitzschioides, Strain L26-B" /LENGTH=219 /DNA_ID=CAMNT_0038938531 /DNA_START=17 /DNA_END=673 /DNA_ORIENTATION=-
MASSYSASSVFHALPQRERKVKFDFEAVIEPNDISPDEDLKLAIRLQKEENALAIEAEQRRVAAISNSGRRRSGRSCAHGFGLKTVPHIPKVDTSQETRQRSLSPTRAPPMVQQPSESEDSFDEHHTIQEVRSDSPTSSILRHSSPSKLSSSFREQSKPFTNHEEGEEDLKRPAWLKTQEVENSAKECWQETEKILKEDTKKYKDFTRRTGMGMFAPKW